MDALDLTKELIAMASPSGESNGEISAWVEQRLVDLGFDVERIEYRDAAGVMKVNVVARRGPEIMDEQARGLAYFAHTDVVPADDWTGPGGDPYRGAFQDGRLYGRGSCDMKGSLACMLAAVHRLGDAPLPAPLFVVCTADEEVGFAGAREVVARSEIYREMVRRRTRALIGEPTNLEVVHAHKGICGFRVVSRGRAAHSGTVEGINANLAMIPFLQEMKAIHDETEARPDWQNVEFEPPTLCWNIGINDYNRALNMTSARSVCTVFFRPLPGVSDDQLVERCRNAAGRCGLEFQLDTRCDAVYTDPENPLVLEALALAGRTAPRTVAYGTDGSELAELPDKIVCGPGDIAQAHTCDEWIDVAQLTAGVKVFEKFVRLWCLQRP